MSGRPSGERLCWAAMLFLLACSAQPPLPLLAVTFNTGTTEGLDHDALPDDGYTSAQAALSDAWYGDGLAWMPAVEATADFFARIQPDVVAFQEIFWTGECADIPAAHHTDFVCQDNAEPTVALQVLGAGWQVMCHPDKPDKCMAVHEDFGRFVGCDDDLCLDGMTGYPVEGCGSGARVARAEIEQVDGQRLTVVSIHGSSGFSAEEQDCRVAQFAQAFTDLGDGAPGASGARNLVMGDLNTDPGRLLGVDPSADAFAAHVADGFVFHTEVGEDATPTYAGVLNIDHVVSDSFTGGCTAGSVTDAVYFDHLPIICTLQ